MCGLCLSRKSHNKATCDGQTIPSPFGKKSKFSIYLDQESKVIYSLFCCMLSWLLSKYIETEFQSKSKTRVTNCELRVQIYESRVENHEFRVQIHELGD